jgi:hypothetical protein
MWSFEEFIDDRYTYIRSSATGNPCKKDPENHEPFAFAEGGML